MPRPLASRAKTMRLWTGHHRPNLIKRHRKRPNPGPTAFARRRASLGLRGEIVDHPGGTIRSREDALDSAGFGVTNGRFLRKMLAGPPGMDFTRPPQAAVLSSVDRNRPSGLLTQTHNEQIRNRNVGMRNARRSVPAFSRAKRDIMRRMGAIPRPWGVLQRTGGRNTRTIEMVIPKHG